jgi:hypothetical protein
MNEVVGLLASAIGLILIPVLVARRLLGRADLAALYRAPDGDGWPRGVQEADCPRWNLRGVRTATAARQANGAPLPWGALAELIPSTALEAAALDPRAGRDPRAGQVVQPRVAVHARVGLAGLLSRPG